MVCAAAVMRMCIPSQHRKIVELNSPATGVNKNEGRALCVNDHNS
jgi:hypothetical protein